MIGQNIQKIIGTGQKIIGKGQDKSLFLEFITFCDAQPKDKAINHLNWDTCAIGEFRDAHYPLDQHTNPFISGNFQERILGVSDRYRFNLKSLVGGANCPETYGGFTEFLKSYLPTEEVSHATL